MKRGLVVRVGYVRIGAAPEQRFHGARLAVHGRQHERCSAFGVPRVDVDMVVESRLKSGHVAGFGRTP